MGFEAIRSDRLDETVYAARLPSGLAVRVWPKAGLNKKFAAFATRFGSVDSRYRPPGGGEAVAVPDGMAHFLEHKLFEGADGDASDRFARLGASCNAGTSFTTTAYYFTCTDRFDESLDVLLDFVQEPYFTEASVQKERGIIEQEIRMYDDQPDWQVFVRLLGALFKNHPVRTDIAGTVESIAQINTGNLRAVYDAFYHPGNMAVLAAGDVDPAAVLRQVEEGVAAYGAAEAERATRLPVEEPGDAARHGVTHRMAVSRPKVLIGFKEIPNGQTPEERMRAELATNLALDLVFGKASDWYARAYADGVVDDTFSASFVGEIDHGYSMIGVETDEPERFVQAVTGALAEAAAKGFDATAVERNKRKRAGRFLRNFNAADTAGMAMMSLLLRGQDLFACPEILDGIRPGDLSTRLEEHIRDDAMAVATILPLGSEEAHP